MDTIITGLGDVSNDAEWSIAHSEPYRCEISIEGHADLLFHRWSVDGVAEKASAAKGSKSKKTDDIESYVWRDEKGTLCIPGEYLRRSVVLAAKFQQDPRSPRKSAMDLFSAGIVNLTPLATLGTAKWDYVDRRRVTVQRNGITRHRPAMRAPWKAKFIFMVSVPEYIGPTLLQQTIAKAGLLVGVGDFRPTFGRFGMTGFNVLKN